MRYLKALCLATTVIAGAMASTAFAEYPDRPIKLVLGYAPGGSVDAVARVIAPKLGEALGQTVVIEYRAGAAGIIGARAVAGADPDGYTLHLVESATLVILPSLQAVGYDPASSFTPIATVASAGMLLAANPKVAARGLPELVSLMKAEPGKYSYATSGVGSVGHVGMEMLQIEQGMKSTHIAYKGGGPAMSDVIGGQVPLTVSSLAPAIPQIKAGTIQPIGITSAKRSGALPEVKTIAEQGMPGFEALAWYALVGPAGLPAEVVKKVSAATTKIMQDPQVLEGLKSQGLDPEGDAAADLAKRIADDSRKWKSVISTAGISLQ